MSRARNHVHSSVGLAASMLGMLIAGSGAAAEAAVYSGHLKGVPGSMIELTFTKEDDGRLYLDQLRWDGAPWTCDNGSEVSQSLRGYNPPDGRVERRRFRILQSAPENNYAFTIAGELRKSSNATGILRHRGEHSDPSYGVCDTGRLEWKASRLAPRSNHARKGST